MGDSEPRTEGPIKFIGVSGADKDLDVTTERPLM